MNRREFLSKFAVLAVAGVVIRPSFSPITAATAVAPAATQVALANFGTGVKAVGSYDTAQGTYALLTYQNLPFWLHSVDGRVWRTTTPPWRVRRMASQGGSL